MKNLKKRAFTIFSGLMMIMNAETALSSTTQASAIIDWSTFTITGYGLGLNAAPIFTLNGQSSNASSSVSDWVSWTSDTPNNAHLLGAHIEGTGAGTGSANASRSANLTISGSGFLVISADYAINAVIAANNCYGYYCYDQNSASASVNFNVNNNSLITSGSSASQDNLSLGNPGWNNAYSGLTSAHKQGILSVGLMVNNGDILNFSSALYASAHDNGLSPITNVPVPAAIGLFGTGLIGLVGLGRRR